MAELVQFYTLQPQYMTENFSLTIFSNLHIAMSGPPAQQSSSFLKMKYVHISLPGSKILPVLLHASPQPSAKIRVTDHMLYISRAALVKVKAEFGAI